MKKIVFSAVYFLAAVITTLVLYQIRMEEGDIYTYQIFEIARKISSGYQMRQIGAIAFLFFLGIPVTVVLMDGINSLQKKLLIYPFGITEWIVISVVLLLLGIPYSFFSMMAILLIINILLIVIWRIKIKKEQESNDRIQNMVSFICILFGTGIILSSGLLFVYMSFDSVYFINFWGKSIAIEGKLTEFMSTYLTATGFGIATLSSLSYMVGMDHFFWIHQLLIIDVLALFVIKVNTKIRNEISKYHFFYSLGFMAFIFTIPIVAIVGGWIISNSYIMIYLILLIFFIEEISHTDKVDLKRKLVLSIICFLLPFLRVDAGITICGILIGLSISAIVTKDILQSIFLPSFLGIILYFLKIYSLIGEIDGLFLSDKTILEIIGSFGIIGIYYLCLRNKWIFNRKYFISTILTATMGITFIMTVLEPEKSINTYKVLLYNFSKLREGYWEISLFWLLLFLAYTTLKSKAKMSYLQAIVLVLLIETFLLALLRGAVLDLPARMGYGDSFNRIFASYIPLCVYSLIDSLFPCKTGETGQNYAEICKSEKTAL